MSYTLEYAKSNKSSCSGKKASCPSETYSIAKGELRLGVEVPNMRGMKWRHWVCTTPKVIENMQADFASPEQIHGWEDLRPDDQERVQRAWEDGQIPENELPEPAPEHVKPLNKKRNDTSLPTTNETDVVNKGSKKAKVTKEDEPESSDTNKNAAENEEVKSSPKKGTKSESRKSSKVVQDKKPSTVTKKTKNKVTDVDSDNQDNTTTKKPAGSKAKKTSTSEAPDTEKTQTPSDGPKVASFATRNKSVKTTENKSKGEPTRKSSRLSALKQEETKPDINAKMSAAPAIKKRTMTKDETGVSKKAKKN